MPIEAANIEKVTVSREASFLPLIQIKINNNNNKKTIDLEEVPFSI
jgi:hypothetical protein